MKKIIFIAFALIAFACSSDDDNSSVSQYEGPIPSDQLIDWVSGDASEIGLRFNTDRLEPYSGNNAFQDFEFQIKITPKPGYEDIPYKVYANHYSFNPLGDEFYHQEAVGDFTGDFVGIPGHIKNSFHVYMSDYMEYDAEILFKAENFTGDPFNWSAQGHERRD